MDRAQQTGDWTEVLLTKGTQDEDEIITIVPTTIWTGLPRIGGYFAFLNIAILCMRVIHHQKLNKELKDYLTQNAYLQEQRLLTQQTVARDPEEDEEQERLYIAQFYSFENFTLMHK